MIVAAIMNGWSSSARPTRTHQLIADRLFKDEEVFALNGMKSSVFPRKARKMRRFIRDHEMKSNVLIAVGKSLGAKHMLNRVLRRFQKLDYKALLFLSIDPNWPTWDDWTPNLNNRYLDGEFLDNLGLVWGQNIYVIRGGYKQAGCPIYGSKALRNIPVMNKDHYSIVKSDEVSEAVDDMVALAKEIDHA